MGGGGSGRGLLVGAPRCLEMALVLAADEPRRGAPCAPLPPLQLRTAVTHQGRQWWGLFALGAGLLGAPSALPLLLDLPFAAHHSHSVREHTEDWPCE